MRLYVLRHEDRTVDASFFAPLTEKGLNNSKNLIKRLGKLKINKVYSSPFIRTLQTVYPYVKTNGLKINLEYSLSEIQHPHIIPEKSYQISLPLYLAESFNYNPKYISMLKPEHHKFPESEKDVYERVKKFIHKLLTEKMDSNDNILIVAHQIVINCILKMATKKKSIDIDYGYNYPKGALSLIFDKNEWLFESINWEK
jgi:broad specificity phosphatase PhoE